jgi:hypothetical protein
LENYPGEVPDLESVIGEGFPLLLEKRAGLPHSLIIRKPRNGIVTAIRGCGSFGGSVAMAMQKISYDG